MTEIKIAWFEIPAANLDRAAKFYKEVMQAQLAPMDTPSGKIMAFFNGEMPVGCLTTAAKASKDGIRIFLTTADIEAALGRAESAGGSVAMGKTSIGPFGHIGMFVDSEGNSISLHSD